MSDVSVIIPTWNRAAMLEKAVRSALAQTHPPLEVLVCDDGSTDNSRMVVEAIGDPRIRWVEGLRGGRPAIPRNRGIRESQGEWLAFLDDDDEWFPEKLERQLAALTTSGGLACSSNALRYIPGKGEVGCYLTVSHKFIAFDELLKVNQVICSSTLLHRSLFPLVVGFPEDARLKVLEDYALWLRVATQTSFTYLPEPLLFYWDDAENSHRGTAPTSLWTQRRTVFRDFKGWAKENGGFPVYLRKINWVSLSDLGKCSKGTLIDRAKRLKKIFAP